MYSIRLRGIYAVALAALMQENGWQIVQPSEELQPYADPLYRFAPFDVDVRDRDDRHGVVAVGAEAPLNALKALLFDKLPDAICVPAAAELGAIYLGIVQKRRAGGYDIDLGYMRGFLPHTERVRPLKKGEAIRVQVTDISHHQPIVTTSLSVAGRFVVLSQENGVGISKEITDPKERERLLVLGRRFCANGWGVIWRTGAYHQDIRELREEIRLLQQELPQLDGHPEEGIPGKVRAGQRAFVIEFPGGSKQVLDQCRARLVPTARGHHQQHLEQNATAVLTVGDLVSIEHVKVQSELSVLMTGRVLQAHPHGITVRREIRGKGLYDGLGIPKEPGDYALSKLCVGAWQYETRYYSHDGQLKGIYININTPIEIYSDRVRYIDLELDVVQRPGELPTVIDEPNLQKITDCVSPRVAAQARAIAHGAVTALRSPGNTRGCTI